MSGRSGVTWFAKKDSDLEDISPGACALRTSPPFFKKGALVWSSSSRGLLVLVLLFVLASYWFHLMIEGVHVMAPPVFLRRGVEAI